MKQIIRYLRVDKWTRLADGRLQDENSIDIRPRILLSQACVFGSIAAIVQTVMDLVSGSYLIAAMNFWFVLVLMVVYILNEKGYHKTAKYIFLSVINVSLLLIANLLPKEVGVYLIFFPLIGITYIFLIKENNVIKVLFIAFPIVELFLLELVQYQMFGPVDLGEQNVHSSFIVNLGLSTLVFSFAINYQFTLNSKAESILEQNKNKFQKLAEQIEEKNRTLEKANKELDQFAYSTSHDLRAPLASVLGLINITKLESNPEKTRQYLTLMEDRINNLDNFIKDITNYSRNSRLEIKKEDIEIDHLLEEAIENHKYVDNAAHINFHKEINYPLVKADKSRLQVVLNNLVNNAIKYHDLSKDQSEIRLKVNRVNGHVNISVKDNGPGIDTAEQQKIFNMFYRASETSSGSGLGLYIVKETVEKMNGEIDLTSSPGEGSEFVVKIPAN
ncbi:MAG: HAMP domain-containing sensor histidine kinase [Bacteroidota bacterium]